MSAAEIFSIFPCGIITTTSHSRLDLGGYFNRIHHGLPKSKGYEVIFVVVNKLSKYGHFIPLKHLYTSRKVTEIFAKEVVRLHGYLNPL